MIFGSRGSLGYQALGGGPIRHCPFDSAAAENVWEKLFIRDAGGPFEVLDVASPLKTYVFHCHNSSTKTLE